MLKKPLKEKVKRDIEKDVMRTFTDKEGFNDESETSLRHPLRRILYAMAVENPELGYVQGMNFIATGLLYGLNPENFSNKCFSFGRRYYSLKENPQESNKFEEIAFWLMRFIFEELHWKEIFGKNFAKVRSLFASFESRLLNSSMSDAFLALDEIGIGLFELFSSFFYSLMIHKFPLEQSARLIDIFFLETEAGMIDLLMRLLHFCKPQIYELKHNPEKLLKLVQDDMVESVLIFSDKLFASDFDV